MANFFYDIVAIGLDLLMPIKRIKKISADVPWMTDKLKTFIKKDKKPFSVTVQNPTALNITEILSIAREKRVNQNTIRPRFTVKKKITLKLGGVKSNA
ncbi:Hypothetical predicted protein [Paramuricea clavata]|nr:Hypothetical predicted protein [Paramuricea clavata]